LPDTKSILRKRLRERRLNLTPQEQHTASHQATYTFLQSLWFQQSTHIGLYIAHNGEINPADIIDAAIAHNKTCYLPVLRNGESKYLKFLPFHPDNDLRPNIYGIPEPDIDDEHAIELTKLDVVLAPLVGFDQFGHRLGMGAGYYDRTFSFLDTTPRPHSPKLIGLAYAFQQIASLDAEPWDIALDAVCTDHGIIDLTHC